MFYTHIEQSGRFFGEHEHCAAHGLMFTDSREWRIRDRETNEEVMM